MNQNKIATVVYCRHVKSAKIILTFPIKPGLEAIFVSKGGAEKPVSPTAYQGSAASYSYLRTLQPQAVSES